MAINPQAREAVLRQMSEVPELRGGLAQMAANNYFQIMFAVEDTSVSIIAKAAQAGSNGTLFFARPAVPSMILEVTRVQQ